MSRKGDIYEASDALQGTALSGTAYNQKVSGKSHGKVIGGKGVTRTFLTKASAGVNSDEGFAGSCTGQIHRQIQEGG